MSLPEEDIIKHLDHLLTTSDPGDDIHHMHVVTAPNGPLGAPNLDERKTSVYAIVANDPTRGTQQQIAQVIAAAAVQAHTERCVILFAGISQEAWTVHPFDDQARKLRRAGISLAEHPNALEITVSYGATRDGRRWNGYRYLTGPQAGELHTELVVGRPTPDEGLGYVSQLIRKLVGLPVGH